MPGHHFKFNILVICSLIPLLLFAEDKPIKIFGYFQNGFQYQKSRESANQDFDDSGDPLKRIKETSFMMQQLNIFVQKELSAKWNAFINLEMLNSFSSSRRWGSFNLEEAWVRYRSAKEFNLKLGLQIPIFNNLNEIKNKTPLLPYIIRPLVYESSFGEFLSLEEYQPFRAFVQAYGFVPRGKWKLDYAIYLGNSPNINDDKTKGQTGIDTTAHMLVGGRIGIRYDQLKLGVSGTFEKFNELKELYNRGIHLQFPELSSRASDYEGLAAFRFGSDLSYYWPNVYLESEYIRVTYNDNFSQLNFDKWFYYVTLGYRILEHVDIYASYWYTHENHLAQEYFYNWPELAQYQFDIVVASIGISHHLNDNIILKGQWAPVDIDHKNAPIPKEKFTHAAFAITVIF